MGACIPTLQEEHEAKLGLVYPSDFPGGVTFLATYSEFFWPRTCA